jgi:type IV fimbrial biogenesis protein FimT
MIIYPSGRSPPLVGSRPPFIGSRGVTPCNLVAARLTFSPDKETAMKPFREAGVTLIEMMVAIAVTGILLALAAPSFTETIRKNRIESTAQGFLNALNFARTEAIRRGMAVTVYKNGNQWENGYIAFVDANKNGKQDSGEETLRTWQALPSGYTLRTNVADFVRYNARGEVDNNSTGGYFIVCYDSTNGAKAVLITRMRPVMAADTNNDGIPESNSGNNIGSCN